MWMKPGLVERCGRACRVTEHGSVALCIPWNTWGFDGTEKRLPLPPPPPPPRVASL